MSDDVAGACLLERLQRPQKTLDGELPGGTKIVWRLLSATERQQAKGRARVQLRSVGIDPDVLLNADELEQETGWQIVAIAMRDPRYRGSPTNPYPVPASYTEDEQTREKVPDANKLRDTITIQEFAVLFDQYMDFEDRENPQLERLGEAEIEVLAAAVKKKDRRALIEFGADTLSLYLLTTANPPEISPTGKSGSGTASETTNPATDTTLSM